MAFSESGSRVPRHGRRDFSLLFEMKMAKVRRILIQQASPLMAEEPPPPKKKRKKGAGTMAKPAPAATKKRTSGSLAKAADTMPQMVALNGTVPVLNISLTAEYAAVREDDWDDLTIDPVPFASLRAAKDHMLALPCYSHGDATRPRAWMTEISRRTAPVCQDGTQDRFVIVRLVSFR
ncbi:hypothetical protein QMO56_11295 [Roseomonas sp. E05]|uniref:hypothetical protein n=1 Tax=Roseomonas sp. E05 TaxID=3046310 RepID=UPI0024BBC01F|nr:hypothetical protein [Roseomonas sp. E05]MDJ0388698.1 hypothetical protein [Roseomonas sp. E05]